MSGTLPDNALQLWLQDETNDQFSSPEALEGMYNYFLEGADDPVDSIKEDDRHHCFIIFQQNDAGASVCSILHHLARAPSRMGNPTLYDGNWYLTGDQIIGGNQITYELPGSLFTEKDPAQCYTPDRIQREIGNNPELTKVNVIVEDGNLTDLEQITTRRGMWIPNPYAALCLDEGLTPVEVWSRVYGLILQNGHGAACKPLVKFLQYQAMGAVEDNEAIFSHEDLLQPRVTADFVRHRTTVLSHLHSANDGNGGSGGGSGNATHGTGGPFGMNAQQFQTFVEAMRGGHTGPAPTPGAPNHSAGTVDKRWNINLPTLLKFVQVTDINMLPPVWSALAKGPRKEERNILQAALDDHTHSAGAATKAKLTITKELLSTVVSLTFWSGDFDLLTEGLHPYRTLYVSAAKQAQDQVNLQTYDALAKDGTLRLEDVQLFQLVLKSNWPTDFLQLDTSIKLYHNLLSVLFPLTHPLFVSYNGMLKVWKSMHILFAEHFNKDHNRPSQFLRSLQLRVALYWQSIASSSANDALLVPPPNFHELLMSVSLQTWIPPSMPGQTPSLGSTLPPGTPSSPPPANPVPRPPATPSGGAGGNDGSGDGASRQYEVRNPNLLPDVSSAMQGRNFQLRILFGRGRPPPQHADGRPMCCTYHLRGRCSNTCSRAYSHCQLANEERETLCTFLRERIVTPDIGRGASAPANDSTGSTS